MNDMKSQIVANLKVLTDGLAQIGVKLGASSLTDEERQVLHLKFLIVKMIFDFLELMKSTSKKHKELVTLCMRGGRCSSQSMRDSGFETLDQMRYARNKLEILLEATVFNTEIVNRLVESDSLAELEEIRSWYVAHVFHNRQLMLFIAKTNREG